MSIDSRKMIKERERNICFLKNRCVDYIPRLWFLFCKIDHCGLNKKITFSCDSLVTPGLQSAEVSCSREPCDWRGVCVFFISGSPLELV